MKGECLILKGNLGKEGIVKKQELRVKYKIKSKQSDKLDKAIEALAKKFGFKWWASGFDFVDKYRDECFEK